MSFSNWSNISGNVRIYQERNSFLILDSANRFIAGGEVKYLCSFEIPNFTGQHEEFERCIRDMYLSRRNFNDGFRLESADVNGSSVYKHMTESGYDFFLNQVTNGRFVPKLELTFTYYASYSPHLWLPLCLTKWAVSSFTIEEGKDEFQNKFIESVFDGIDLPKFQNQYIQSLDCVIAYVKEDLERLTERDPDYCGKNRKLEVLQVHREAVQRVWGIALDSSNNRDSDTDDE